MKKRDMKIFQDAIEKITRIEEICSRDVGRGIDAMASFAKGGLLAATKSVACHPSPSVAILTGFYVPHGSPPSAETDGPIGSVHLGGLSNVGVPVRIATDSLCMDVVKCAARSVNVAAKIDWDEIGLESDNESIRAVLNAWKDASVSHVISLERAGPASDGTPCNMKGDDIGPYTAPLHLLFNNDGGRTTIGIGDGGNELGMGSVPRDIIRSSIRNGGKIACQVPCDHLIVCGVSNWGGFALAAALTILRPDWAAVLKEGLTLENDYGMLKAIVEKGPAVDGVNGGQTMSVDGYDWEFHSRILKEILDVIR